jgi:cytochrome c-type biogenesis protein
MGPQWGLVLGPLLILMGLLWPGWIRVPLPALAVRAWRPASLSGAFLLGGAFSLAVYPVCSPALAALLGVTAGIGSPLAGTILLLAFAAGRAIPIAAGAVAIGSLENLRVLSEYRRIFEIVGGLTLIASGLYVLNAYYYWIPALAS